MKKRISRRTAFLRIAGLGAVASAEKSFGFLGLFGGKKKGLEPDTQGRVILSLNDEKYRQLKNNGTSVKIDVKGKGKPLIVIRRDEHTVLTLSSKCTHLGCEVASPQNGTLICPCHKSKFTTDGTVIKGPAKRNLEKFRTEADNDTITIFL